MMIPEVTENMKPILWQHKSTWGEIQLMIQSEYKHPISTSYIPLGCDANSVVVGY